MSGLSFTREKGRLSLKVQAMAAPAAVVCALALPQLFHAVGAISGTGTSLGEVFLPMHLPIILAGLLAGPFTGAAAGALAPLFSFAISGMPTPTALPFMTIELAFYGFMSGFLRNVKLPSVMKVIISQISGRIARATAILAAIYVFGNQSLQAVSVWNSVLIGIPGLVLQCSMIPLFVFWVENRKNG